LSGGPGRNTAAVMLKDYCSNLESALARGQTVRELQASK
jgi:hypothetical protein